MNINIFEGFAYFRISQITLIDYKFFVFLFASGFLYYTLHRRCQKYILLIASLYFYASAASTNLFKLSLVILYISCVSYFGALFIDFAADKLRKLLTWLAVLALVSALFVLKDAYNIFSLIFNITGINYNIERFHFFSLLGLSYYTLSAIGYILDVSWGSYKAERNLFKLMLYIFYFPALISGPVMRYSQMREQFNNYHALEYNNIAYGLRRMIWGYFKKLIISERFGIIVSAVYSNYNDYNGLYLIFAVLCYAVQLYTDFSGCMDIIMGASNLFGINLPENFDAPFFSLSLKDFWRRWHISLGLWFKDYVMYPVQISSFMIKTGKICRQKFGKKVGKKVPFYLSMLVLWTLIGLWHGGTAHYFIASGIVPFILITLSDLLGFINININLFNRIKTLLLMCVSFIFICTSSVSKGLEAFKIIFTKFAAPVSSKVSLINYLSLSDIILMFLGLIILLFADYLQYNKKSLTQLIDKQRALVQYAFIYCEILLIMFYGMLGNSSFIYFQF